MSKIIKTGFLLTLMMLVACPAVAVVLNFDDINTGGEYAQIPSGYKGFSWDENFWVVNNSFYKNNFNNSNNFPSNFNAAFNVFGEPIVFISNTTPFLLAGADFSTWAENNTYNSSYSSIGLKVTGFLNNNPVGSIDIDLETGFVNYQLITLGWVDKVTFETSEESEGYWWLMDNLEIQPVPEPATMLLLGSGLIGVLGLRRKFKK